jgi:hypothetical protein
MSLFQLLRAGVSASEGQNKVDGVVVGIVKDIKDPQNLGRVKVDFPWLAEDADAVSISSEEDRAHSFWARIATFMAGKGRGAYFVPEVDDEVLVAFEHGDIDRPFVLGGLWNVDDAPPESMDSAARTISAPSVPEAATLFLLTIIPRNRKLRLLSRARADTSCYLTTRATREKLRSRPKLVTFSPWMTPGGP